MIYLSTPIVNYIKIFKRKHEKTRESISLVMYALLFIYCYFYCFLKLIVKSSKSFFLFQQEGSLCAQHCLNALLQNQYFSAVDLAQIGTRLDEQERERMAEGGIGTSEYQRFIEV